MEQLLEDLFDDVKIKADVDIIFENYQSKHLEVVKDMMLRGYQSGKTWAAQTDFETLGYAVNSFQPCYVLEDVLDVGKNSLNDPRLGGALKYCSEDLPIKLTWWGKNRLIPNLSSYYFVFWEFGWHQAVISLWYALVDHHVAAMKSAFPLLKAYRP